MTRLSESVARTLPLITSGDLSTDRVVRDLLGYSADRRHLDLSDLDPVEQAVLVAGRSVEILPGVEALAGRIGAARDAGRGMIVKLGIDPTAADVHLGHAVPMIVLSRFQRMGHQVILIVGDITAKIGDPSGRSTERPPLTDADIEANMASYRSQVAPFFDFGHAQFRHNSEWLAQIRLPELIEILSQVPASMSLQREDFRNRMAQGHGLAMSELIYSVVMAIDSAKIDADVELGGIDQLLNMQMGRKVMEILGQSPQLVVAMPLIEGTDGTGAKMSKSAGNYIPLTADADEIFGKVMSIPDRLTAPYLRAWSEWTDPEIEAALARVADRSLHPMDFKKIVAGEAVTAIHGVEAAMAARENFAAHFSRRSFADVESVPSVALADQGQETVGAVLARVLEFTQSVKAARRMAQQGGVRVVVEAGGGEQDTVVLDEAGVLRPLAEVIAEVLAKIGRPAGGADVYLKAGRKLARITEG